MKEQAHHIKAFEYYYSLGESRSLEQVAEELKVSLASVKLWSSSFGWLQRVQEREAEVARTLASKAISEAMANRARNKQLIRMALLQLAKALADGKIKMNLLDLVKLIQLEELLDEKICEQLQQDDPESNFLEQISRRRKLLEARRGDEKIIPNSGGGEKSIME